MTMYIILGVTCMVTLMTLCQGYGQGQDVPLVSGSFGSEVVEAVIRRIRSSCIFSEDRLFLRRTAYVMSRDGLNTDTYRAGYDGGIWQVTESMFQATQDCNNPLISLACRNVSSKLNFFWPSAKWSDLRKPLYSGVAAALSSLLTLEKNTMPGNLADQALYWARMYGRPIQHFLSEAPKTPPFKCEKKMDLAFILDSSGSVSESDFNLMLDFAGDVVDVMDVSQNGVRIADIVFSSSASVSFDFDDHSTKAAVKSGFLGTIKIDSGTNTGEALDLARETLNSTIRGARDNVRKVAVLVTDGFSENPTATIEAAKHLKDKGTTVFAVGVSDYNLTELQAVASDPICTHVMTLTSFDYITSILTEIQKSTCEVNLRLPNTGPVVNTKPEETIEITNPGPDQILAVYVSCGVLNIYVSTTDSKPGPAVFDKLYTATPDCPAVLDVVDPLPQGAPVYVTVTGTRIPTTAAGLEMCTNFSWTIKWIKKYSTMICEENGVRHTYYRNVSYTESCSVDTYPVDNPCTLENLQKGILRYRYPYDPTKFLQCDYLGNYYISTCPDGTIFNAQTRVCGFTSPGRDPITSPRLPISPIDLSSPCNPQNLAKNIYYHTYIPDKTKFVQCDEWGNAYVMPCAPSTQWSQVAYTCVHIQPPRAVTSCVEGELKPDPCDHHKFYQCTASGDFARLTCHPSSLFFNPDLKVCDWNDSSSAPVPAFCFGGIP